VKRKTSQLPTRLYKYALGEPGHNAELVNEQLCRARVYRNALIELELQARGAYRKQRSEISSIHALEQRIAEQLAQLEVVRTQLQAAAPRDPAALEARTRKLEVLANLRALRGALREERQRAAPLLRERADEIRKQTLEAIKAARKSSGVYWGTYQLVEQAVEQMRRSPADPRFERWDGRGSVGVQLSGGIASDEVFGSDTRIRIEPIAPDTFARRGRSYRTPNRLTTLHLRIGSCELGKPIWASWPLIFDRPLPSDGRIKSAWVTRRNVGTHRKWELCVAVEAASFLPPARADLPRTAASVHFTSHKTARGVRVAYVCGSDGAREEILLPQRFLERHEKCESLSEQRAHKLSAAREALRAYVTEHEVPSWLATGAREPTAGRLGDLALHWRAHRFEGDEAAYLALETWRKEERRLLEWQVNNRDKGYLHRREHFRLASRAIAQRYATLVLDDTDFRATQPRESRSRSSKLERRERALAACGELRAILKYMAEKHGCRVVVVPAGQHAGRCHVCGGDAGLPRALPERHACARCGASWDVDENAARLLLGRAALFDAAE